MNNSKMLLLTTITIFSSFSIIKAELSELSKEEEKSLIEQLALTAFEDLVDGCERYGFKYPKNNYSKRVQVFNGSITRIPYNKLKPVLDKCDEKIAKKIQ